MEHRINNRLTSTTLLNPKLPTPYTLRLLQDAQRHAPFSHNLNPKNITMKKIHLFALLLTFCAPTFAESSDCTKAGTDMEKYLCLVKQNHEENRTKATSDNIILSKKIDKPTPVRNPSECKNNPKGYIYFQVGDEVFRQTKDSPIHIDTIFPSLLKSQDTDILQGCKGNPYIGASVVYKYKEGQNPIGKFEFYHFKIQGVPHGEESIVSWDQMYQEQYFDSYKSAKKDCANISVEIERCIWFPENKVFPPSKAFRINSLDHLGKHLTIGCLTGSMPECKTTYRLYPSVDFTYSYFPEKNHIDEKDIGLLDKYLRQQFEFMRVKVAVKK